jgi:hypothetical protein
MPTAQIIGLAVAFKAAHVVGLAIALNVPHVAGLAVALGVVASLLLLSTRSLLRRPRVIHRIWIKSRSRSLGSTHRTLRETVLWGLAQALELYAGRPLRVQAFEGAKKTDPAAVSSALSAAMSHIGSSRSSGVDLVSAPIGAGTAMEAIADAVKGAPSGGELAAGLLRLFGWLIARGELQLSGHVLCSRLRGPGLALTLATAGGRVLERETIWACDFEPAVGVDETFADGDDADRLLRVATAGAVWTHFTIFEEVWGLREQELKARFQTASWRSYALMQVGIDGQAKRRPEVTRALYARAVDDDPSNMVAQFNLASAELKDELFNHVRTAGADRLRTVHESLHVKEGPEAEHEGAIEIEQECRLLNSDPLHHQVMYKQVGAKLNHDVTVEESLEEKLGGCFGAPVLPYALWLPRLAGDAPGGGQWMRTGGLSLGCADLKDLGKHLGVLEQTLVVLREEDKRQWAKAGSKQWVDLRQVLCAIEGPMLVLWAMVALRVGRPVWAPWPADALRETALASLIGLEYAEGSAQSPRGWLIERLREGSLTPGEAVSFACSSEVSRTSRTHFNLACWYADMDRLSKSLHELELSLEYGGPLAGQRLCDSQLRRVRRSHSKQWRKLRARYMPPSESTGRDGRSSGDAGRNGRSGSEGRNGRSGNAGRNGRSGNAGRNGRSGNAGRNGRGGSGPAQSPAGVVDAGLEATRESPVSDGGGG